MAINLLHIDSSIFGENGASPTLGQYFIEQLKHYYGNPIEVTHRNVSTTDALPHFSMETIASIGENTADLADTLIAEAQNADVILLGAPMYNFGVPSQLKSWIDHISRAGVTFRYTAEGPEGLLKDKRVFVIHTHGGQHANTPRDTIQSYLNTVLGFLGLTDVTHIVAEGLNMSDLKDNAITQAKTNIEQTVSAFTETFTLSGAEIS